MAEGLWSLAHGFRSITLGRKMLEERISSFSARELWASLRRPLSLYVSVCLSLSLPVSLCLRLSRSESVCLCLSLPGVICVCPCRYLFACDSESDSQILCLSPCVRIAPDQDRDLAAHRDAPGVELGGEFSKWRYVAEHHDEEDSRLPSGGHGGRTPAV